MTMKSDSQRERGLLPFEIIVAANEGDPEAVATIMKHYESYMKEQAKRWFVKPNGESNYAVDYEIYDELMIKLMEAILSFKI